MYISHFNLFSNHIFPDDFIISISDRKRKTIKTLDLISLIILSFFALIVLVLNAYYEYEELMLVLDAVNIIMMIYTIVICFRFDSYLSRNIFRTKG